MPSGGKHARGLRSKIAKGSGQAQVRKLRISSMHTSWDTNRQGCKRGRPGEGSTCLLPALVPPGTLKSKQLAPAAAPCTSRLDSELISITSWCTAPSLTDCLNALAAMQLQYVSLIDTSCVAFLSANRICKHVQQSLH